MRVKATFVSLIVSLFMITTSFAQEAETFEVIFNCDISVQELSGTFDPATDTLDVRGSFNGWAGPSDILAPDLFDPSLYSTLVELELTPLQDTVYYKYVITNSSGTVWESRAFDPDFNTDNRAFFATGNEPDDNGNDLKEVVLDTVYFSDISPDDIFTTETDIVFEVDMTPAIDYLDIYGEITFGGGDVTSIDDVFLASGHSGTDPEMAWVWDLTPGDPKREALKLNDSGMDGDRVAEDDVWSITVTFNPGAGTDMVWKYGINGFDNEAGFAQNHTGDVSTSPVFREFGSNGDLYVIEPGEKDEFEVVFNCDISIQELSGTFDPATDTLDVRGSFNGWSGPSDILSPDLFNPSLYSTIWVDSLTPIADTVYYKYVITNSSGTVWESRAFDPQFNTDNRAFFAVGNEEDSNGNDIREVVLDTVYFSDIGPDDIFTTETEIVFEVDVTPAIGYLEQYGNITFGGGDVSSIDDVFLASGHSGTDPEMAWVWDLTPGDPKREALKMNDAGTDGDATAGDDIWSITVTFNPGAGVDMVWKYGINGFDNEAGFAANHTGNVTASPVFRVFGSNGTYYDSVTAIDDYSDIIAPEGISLRQNYPNPFNPSTNIEFVLNKATDVQLVVYDVTGRTIRTLVNGQLTAGPHKLVWNGLDNNNVQVGSGIYFYQLRAGDVVQTRKMVMMK